jgi:CheY-like chemotaxis protein
MTRKRIGEIWVEAGIVTEPILLEALERQKGTGRRLGQILEDMGRLSEKNIAAGLAKQYGFRTVTGIANHSFPEQVLKLVKGESALKNLIFPLKLEDKTLYLAMANPLDMETLDSLSFRTGMRIVPCVTTPEEIIAAANRHYLKAGERGLNAPADQSRWTILVVEDQESVRTAVSATLQKEGYEIVQAANGVEGLKAALELSPQLIITDTVMPRMDGYEMFRALRGSSATRDIPVIALTSKAAAEEEAKLLDQGYFDFIAKPINPTRVVARVKRALRLTCGGNAHPVR